MMVEIEEENQPPKKKQRFGQEFMNERVQRIIDAFSISAVEALDKTSTFKIRSD